MRFVRDVVDDAKNAASGFSNGVAESLSAAADKSRAAAWTAGAIGLRVCAAVCLLCALTVFCVWTSVCFYGLLYWQFMPTPYHLLPVHFDFSANPPVAEINLLNKQWQYSSYVLNNTTPSADKSQLMWAGQAYNVFLDLHIPDSPSNQHLGMLTLKMDIFTKLDEGASTEKLRLLATSSRAAIPKYSSEPVRWMWTALFAAPLVTGVMHEDQHLEVAMFDEFLEQPDARAALVRVSVLGGNAHRLEVYDVRLRIVAELRGLRWAAYHWFFTSLVFWVALFVALQCCCIGGVGVRCYLSRCQSPADDDDNNGLAGGGGHGAGNGSGSGGGLGPKALLMRGRGGGSATNAATAGAGVPVAERKTRAVGGAASDGDASEEGGDAKQAAAAAGEGQGDGADDAAEAGEATDSAAVRRHTDHDRPLAARSPRSPSRRAATAVGDDAEQGVEHDGESAEGAAAAGEDAKTTASNARSPTGAGAGAGSVKNAHGGGGSGAGKPRPKSAAASPLRQRPAAAAAAKAAAAGPFPDDHW